MGKAHPPPPAPSHPAHAAASRGPVPSVTPSVQASTAQATPSAPPADRAARSPSAQTLTPASVAAFGPAGTADGDNPQNAALAAQRQPGHALAQRLVRHADFGNCTPGTGLLLDMGRTVTITSVRLSLAGHPGADLQVRAGGQPVLAELRTVATSAGAGGTVALSLTSPVQARYLLIWFTKLPARRLRHLPGQRLRHHRPRPALTGRTARYRSIYHRA